MSGSMSGRSSAADRALISAITDREVSQLCFNRVNTNVSKR